MPATGETAARPTRLGRYELITRIGQGGMAEVQLALQRGPAGFEKLVVVKLVHENLATQKAFVDMLLDEARVAALVKHPNVVDIYDLGEANGRFFIAMEYLEGEPLLAVLRAGREGKRLDPLSTGRLIADTAEGLDAAHELRSMSGQPLQLVHHDISLGNIVVLYSGQVKLVDFGVAKASQTAHNKSKVQGKFSYMAPEKLRGLPGDRRSDIFSLGCVMWEALTLKRLFKGTGDAETMNQILEMAIQPPSKINGDVPPEYDTIVMKALERDPDKRQATAKQVGIEIEEVLKKRGYGARNDRVAKYMQETFKDHIDARKKLVQEVVAKGSASAEVLDAAFKSVMSRPGSEFAIGSGSGSHSGSFGAQFADGDLNKPTLIAAPSFEIMNEERGLTSKSSQIVAQSEPFWHDKKKLAFVASAAFSLAMLVIVIASAAGRGNRVAASTQQPAPVPATGSNTITAAPATPQPAGSAAVVEPAGSGSAVIEMPEVTSGSADEPKGSADNTSKGSGERTIRRPEKRDPEALFKEGFQQYVKGDLKAARATLLKAKAAGPGLAKTWRLLGQVYDKLGEKSAAKAAYQRYLQLAPNAADAAGIKNRLNEL